MKKFKARVDVKSPWVEVHFSTQHGGIDYYVDDVGRMYPQSMVAEYEPLVFGQIFQTTDSAKSFTFLKYKDMDHIYAVEEGCKDSCVVDISHIL